MRPWRYLGANPDGWWCRRGACRGVTRGGVFIDREVPLIARLGVSTVRLEFPWFLIEPRRGTYDWRRSDRIVRTVTRAHLKLQPVLVWTPRWAGKTPATPPTAASFSRFAQAFARRYRASIRHIELWNEPDLARYWNGTQAQYVRRVLVPGYRAIKRGNPRARVILGGPSFADEAWLHRIYDLGGGRSFDVAAFHDYSGDLSILEHARVVKAVLRAYGDARKPVWLGEFGFEEPGTDDLRHAALLEQVLTRPAPIAMAQWYTLRDDYPATCCPVQTVEESTFGLLTGDLRPKRSYGTLRRLVLP